MTPELPIDIFLAIFGYLSPEDILIIRQTSRTFYQISYSHSLWHRLLMVNVVTENIPIPCLSQRPVDSLTTSELENFVFTSLRLRRNWTSHSPSPKRQLNITTISDARIVSLRFLRRKRQHLLLALLSITAGVFTLQCWDIGNSQPLCVASRSIQQFGGMAINHDLSSTAILAVQSSSIEILSIDSGASKDGFVTLLAIPERAEGIHLFSGSRLLTRDRMGRLHLWDIGKPEMKLELRYHGTLQHDGTQSAIASGQVIVVMRATALEIYASSVTGLFAHPIARYTWPWRFDGITLTHQRIWPKNPKEYSPIHILIRFASLFPWPINLLHHYVLHTNPLYSASDPISELNVPYKFPPILRETIGSPVRLFATTDMDVGSYGTIIWIDSHTEDYFGHSDRGQRLAGRFSPVRIEGDEEEALLSDQTATTAANSVFGFQEKDSWIRVVADEEEGKIAVGSLDGEITIFEYA